MRKRIEGGRWCEQVSQALQHDHDPEERDVSIVMPCLNEEATLRLCIEGARDALATLDRLYGLTGEIVVADNGSTDGSREIAERLGARVILIAEKGYGNALRGGIEETRGRYIVIGDSDCSYDFREAVPMVERLMHGYDLCMGSRFKGEIRPGAMPWKNRYIGNPALTRILNLFFNSRVTDAHCGLRALSKEAYRRLGLTSDGMEFASEMIIKASLLGMRRTEVGITLHPDRRTRPPHLRPWRDGWRHLRYLLMLSPAWVFFAPSAIIGFFGLVIFAALAINPETKMVRIGPVLFGDHWMVLSGAAIAISHQTALFGLATTIYGIRAGYRTTSKLLRTIIHVARLEFMILIGVILLLVGSLILAGVIVTWSSTGFGQLHELRQMVVATTLASIGVQNFFGGFLISVISGNAAKPKLPN